MKPIVIVLYMLAAPDAAPEEIAVFWGDGAEAACALMIPGAIEASKTARPGARFWCATPPTDAALAPSRSIIPRPRPERP